MNLSSKYFDSIRINPDGPKVSKPDAGPTCEWNGCDRDGKHRAPRGRNQEGKYLNFCLEHVRAYNKSYNYFAGMGDSDIASYQKSASTGHRPTWSMDSNGGDSTDPDRAAWAAAFSDPFGFFDGETAKPGGKKERRPLRNLERKSFALLDLDGTEPAEEIRTRYKALVKRLHPDANGGDRSFEDRLQEIIGAYHYLRSAGFC
jgi:hypothetical protein